jgi:hypothetical protein
MSHIEVDLPALDLSHLSLTCHEGGIMKNCLFALLILSCSISCFARRPQIKSGATVYIEPMGGYETYLVAAFTKKHVPLIVVADKDKAAYIITSTVALEDLSGSQPGAVVNNNDAANVNGIATSASPSNSFNAAAQQVSTDVGAKRVLGETSASIAVFDASQILFAYSAEKVGTDQLQRTAEDCANHLKKFIEKPRK